MCARTFSQSSGSNLNPKVVLQNLLDIYSEQTAWYLSILYNNYATLCLQAVWVWPLLDMQLRNVTVSHNVTNDVGE